MQVKSLKNKYFISFVLLFFPAVFCHCSEDEYRGFDFVSITSPIQTKTVFEGRDAIWGFDFIDDTRVIFSERSGPIQILDMSTQKLIRVGNVPASQQHGQGGMLDVALHPDFKKNSLVYFSYTVLENNAHETRISRAKLESNQFQDVKILFTSNSGSNKGEHFGSRIVFDHQGHIFFSVGERGNRDDAQKLNLANGKIHRLNEDGTVPNDNPFISQKNAIKSIWSYGHRNPQGLYYDLKTNILWESEHGPRGGDEVNIIEKGKNYGWPVITYGHEYFGPQIGTTKKSGMEQPIYRYIPSIAPSGLAMYHGNLYLGALKLTHLNRLIVDNQKITREERVLEKMQERIRNVHTGPNDSLYISTDTGKIIELHP